MPDPIVVDASALLSVLLEEEGSDAMKGILEEYPLLAPDLIRYESANGILYAQKRRVVSSPKISLKNYMEIIWNFPIQEIPMKIWWQDAVRLVEDYDLTFYDAAYAASAQALKAPLLSLDRKLLRVMKREGIPTVN